mgnify:FL=1
MAPDVKTTSDRPHKVVMIGMDAGEYSLVEQWCDDGSLPNLAALRKRGASGKLASTAGWLAGSPWPSFYTSTTPSEHGLYHYLIWRPEKMTHERPAPDWLPLDPFWRDIGRAGRDVIALDIPIAYAPVPFPGIEISGWATYETLESPASHPPERLSQIVREFGPPPFDNEAAHMMSPSELIEVRDQCVRTTLLTGKVGAAMMAREKWDLFLTCFAATHRAGHQLWDEANMSGTPTPEQAAELSSAMKAVYEATDVAIGQMLEQAGPDATVIVFSLHGMGVNISRSDVMREMLARVLDDSRSNRNGPVSNRRPVDRLRAFVPIRWRTKIKTKLPRLIQDWLTLFWRTSDIDWATTKAFSMFSDLDGYVRVNLKGREPEGIVSPGTEYDVLLDRIERGLKTFVDADTGESVVGRTIRANELDPKVETVHRTIPDMMIHWATTSAAKHRQIVSPEFGAIDWPTPGRHPQARSGNHRPNGFFIAAGDHIAPCGVVEGAHIIDLAPTIYELMSLPMPATMKGKPLAVLMDAKIAGH